MQQQILDLAKDLIRIPSVSADVEQLHVVIDRIMEEFEPSPLSPLPKGEGDGSTVSGVFVEKLESNGKPSLVIKNHEGTRSDICMSVHTDVVPPSEDGQFEPREEDGKLYARGAVDMKSAVSVAIFVMKGVIEQGCKKKVSLLITTDEEIGGDDGAAYLAELGYGGEVMLIPDMDSLDEIVIGEKGILTLHVDVTGKEGHSAYPWNADSALEKAISMYAELKESIEETHELSQKDHRGTSVQMTMCTAGKASNVIPGTASVVFNIRHTESYTETLLKNMCSHIITKHGGEVVSSDYGIMFNASDDDPTIVEYKEFAEKELGMELELARTHGGTDGKKFAEKGATIIMQGLTGANLHGKNEWVEIGDMEKLYTVMLGYICR